MKRYPLFTLILLAQPLTSYALSGGPCHYLTLETEGRVMAIGTSNTHLETLTLGEITLENRHFSPLAQIGNRYHLQLQTLSQGSCNPLQVDSITRIPDAE